MSRKHFSADGEGRTEYDSKPFIAKYHGHCEGDCDDSIEPGEQVSYVDDELMHVYCIPRHQVQTRVTPVCSSCYLQHAGECP